MKIELWSIVQLSTGGVARAYDHYGSNAEELFPQSVRRFILNELDFALVPIGIVLGYGITQVMEAWASVIRVSPQERGSAFLFCSANGMVLVFMYLNFSGHSLFYFSGNQSQNNRTCGNACGIVDLCRFSAWSPAVPVLRGANVK